MSQRPVVFQQTEVISVGLDRNNVGARRQADAGEGADMRTDIQPPVSRQHFEVFRGPFVTPTGYNFLHYRTVTTSRIRVNTQFRQGVVEGLRVLRL